jgi:hypothetical protein
MEGITNDIAALVERIAIAFSLIVMGIEKLIRALKQKDQQANP